MADVEHDGEPSADMARLTGDWVPVLPRAYAKSVVLSGSRVLFPCHDPEKTAEILRDYALEIARRAYRAGHKAAKADMRKALFD